MKTLWDSLPTPFFVLAPMDDVTDTVFRRVVARCSMPDVFFTEFTSVDGLLSKGSKRVAHRLRFDKDEHPIVAQIWGRDPEHFSRVAQTLSQMGFDGIDINFGCPEKSVMKHSCGASLIDEPDLARQIIDATIKGAGTLPVSVKTRIGVKAVVTEEWAQVLLSTGIAALTIHARTAAQMSDVPAQWDEIAKVVSLRNKLGVAVKIIGNGDVTRRADGVTKATTTGADGIMIGRGIFENPWAFSFTPYVPDRNERLNLLLYHVQLFEKEWGSEKPFDVVKKYFKIYVRGFSGASTLRARLMETHTRQDVEKVVNQWVRSASQ